MVKEGIAGILPVGRHACPANLLKPAAWPLECPRPDGTLRPLGARARANDGLGPDRAAVRCGAKRAVTLAAGERPALGAAGELPPRSFTGRGRFASAFRGYHVHIRYALSEILRNVWPAAQRGCQCLSCSHRARSDAIVGRRV